MIRKSARRGRVSPSVAKMELIRKKHQRRYYRVARQSEIRQPRFSRVLVLGSYRSDSTSRNVESHWEKHEGAPSHKEKWNYVEPFFSRPIWRHVVTYWK